MVDKESISNLQPLLLEGTDGFDDLDYDHEEGGGGGGEEEETLSLCDLAVSSTAEDYYRSEFISYKEDQDDGDFFEFSSEDFTGSAYPKPNQSIIFCGKLIPYKGEEAVHGDQTQNQNSTLKQQNPKKSLVSPWKPKKVSATPPPPTGSSSLKSRWYLLAFGSFGKGSGLSTRMELRDIRSRQRRRRVAAPTTMFRFDGGGGDMAKRGEKRSLNKGLWRLLRTLGGKSQRANAAVTASFGCVPYL